jgi:hypothetical protein
MYTLTRQAVSLAVYESSQLPRISIFSESRWMATTKQFEETFIILDALDECQERGELLELLEEINGSGTKKLHILVTSRRERDISEALEALHATEIVLDNDVTSTDIHTHVAQQLQNDPKLRKWPVNIQEEIELALMKGAQGMYAETLSRRLTL